ncbi:U1 small nuclear ribonucleoprotein usp102 [Phyllosticta citriasiana]|uniref:U1 small nuclear ribonucleoprotein usp102 n=3 Tax=Phyllosticta TaxID=121621 RepID=A0ABR1LRE4_9PEZI
MASQTPPNCTVYVKNLEERIKIPELKEALLEIFSEYGNVIDIRAAKNLKAKGQAFVVFDNVESAARAIEEINEFDLFDKPMKLDFARTRSDATVRREGNEEDFEAHRRRRLAEKERKQAIEAQEKQKQLKRPAGAPAQPERPAQKARGAGLKSTGAGGAVIPDEYLPPNKILFVQNLPDGYDVEALSAIFGRFEGFKEVRLVPGRSGIAFVEYEAEAGAISAKEATAGMALGDEGKPVKVTYQRQ